MPVRPDSMLEKATGSLQEEAGVLPFYKLVEALMYLVVATGLVFMYSVVQFARYFAY